MSTTDRNAMTVDIGLGNWLYRRALRTPHRKALTFEGTTWTYGELQDRIDHLASALRAHGVCRGDRVGFLGFNQPRFLRPCSPPPASAPFSCRPAGRGMAGHRRTARGA